MRHPHFDFVIIGGGQAGIPLAHALALSGKRTVLIERSLLGGSCINFGCTPTKAAIASAKIAFDARRADEFGIQIPSVRVDFLKVLEKAGEIAAASRKSLDSGFLEHPNLSLIRGHARLAGRALADFDDQSFEIHVDLLKEGKQILTCDQVVINTGARTRFPQIEGLDEMRMKHPDQILDAGSWLQHLDLPKNLLIIGSGYIAFEMGQFYRRMGAEVTLLEEGPKILKNEDPDVSLGLVDSLAEEGIKFLKDIHVKRIHKTPIGLSIETSGYSGAAIQATHIFIATGRKPNTDDLGLKTVGISLAPGGFIPCDSRLSTSVKGVWVAGDVRGGALFTHTSWDDFRILKSQLLGNGSRTTARIVPYALFTDPELGRVGLTEVQAKSSGRRVEVARFNFSDNGKAKEVRETRGFIKLVVDADTDQVLGAAVLGHNGSEIVQQYVTLMNAKVPYSVMRDSIYIHPTLTEAAQSATSVLSSQKNLLKKPKVA